MRTTKMPGLLCRSDVSTAVCVPGDPRSVIVPRRPDRTVVEHARLMDLKSPSLPDGRRFPPPAGRRRSVTLQMVTKRDLGQPKSALASTLPPSSDNGNVFQVVVLRVSIHCQGCAGKIRKHLSKMEGVTSFSIDLDSKRVTVMGHVSPVGVLESISRVKKAEFWTC